MKRTNYLRQLFATHAIVVAICCTVLVTGILAEDTLPPPGGGTQNHALQQDNPTQQGGAGAAGTGKDGEGGETGSEPFTQNESQPTDDSIKTVESDDVTSDSPSSPPEGISSPQPPSGTDGHQASQQTEGNQADVTSQKTRPDIPTGSTTEPATPSGGEVGKQGDAKQDSASVSSEMREPGTPGVEEKQAVDTKVNPADGKTADSASNDQAGVPNDQLLTEDQPTEEVKTEDIPKEPQVEPADKLQPPPEADEKMPSFDEWKKKMLAEQAQQAKQAKQVKLEAAQGFQPVSGTVLKAKSSNRINYASMSCGAKLIAANSEAKNSGFILTENKDQYMIQPCAAKKWFVVELCEPVAVQNIELANLELFSSLPESFIVHIAERYPTKDWKMLGTFRARDQRAVQTFPIIDEELFAKYIKVEPLTHYGVEHYCPLTILRVYGTTAVEDYEDSEHHDTTGEDEHTPESPKEPSNLFTSATDTVISLVKNVLSPGEKGKEGEPEKGVVQLNGTLRNQSAGNTTAPSPKGEQATPCTPSALSGDTGPGKEPPVGAAHPEIPHVTDKPPLVTLIESHPHSASTVSSLIKQCNFCQDANHPTCYAGRNTLCGYYRVTKFVRGTSCADRSTGGTKVAPLQTKSKQTHKITNPTVAHAGGARPVMAEELEKGQQPKTPEETPGGRVNDKSEKPSISTESKTSPKGKADATSTTRKVSLEPSQGVTTDANAKETHGEVIMTQTPLATGSVSETQSVAAGVTGTTASIQTKPTVAGGSASCDPASTDCGTMGPDIVQIRPTTTEEAMRTNLPDRNIGDQVTDQVQPTATKNPDPAEATRVTGTQSVGTAPENKTNGNGKVIYAEAPSQDYEYDLETVPPPEDGEPYQKLSSGRRETAFMRLRNRINALELNLNLSSRYLEELSQRYRRQMENMYLSLNKTIQKLTNTSRTAEQRDLRQQSNITELMKRINFLTEQSQKLSDNFNDIHTQVIERHLFLMMIEGIVFLLLITWLLNKIHTTPGRVRHGSRTGVAQLSGQQAPQTSLQTSLRPVAQNTKPPDKPKKPVHKVQHKRRNSIDATPPRPRASSIVSKQRSKDDIGLRLSGSEARLGSDVLTAVAAAAANAEFKEIVNRKKKKKKVNRGLLATSQSSSVLQSSSGNGGIHASSSNTRVHHNAGLIFTSKGSRHSPPHSTASSESGDSTTGTTSNTNTTHPLSAAAAAPRHNKVGARRSLDLREMQRGLASGATNNMSKKSHKRQRSEGTINSHGSNKNSITNIGPIHSLSNGNTSPTENGPSQQSVGWKSWFTGSRR